jgi:uncharacterized membrane protein HdeD (DUF308 family)
MAPDDQPAQQLIADVRSSGTVLVVAGLLSCAAGVLALVYPDITLLALGLIAGINVLILSAITLTDVFSASADAGARVLAGVLGILGIIAGITLMRRPGESLLVLLLVLGVWLVVSGIVDFVRAFATLEGRALRLLGALADIVLGTLILALPELSLKTLAVLVGLAFLVRGLIAVATGISLRRAARQAKREAPASAVRA